MAPPDEVTLGELARRLTRIEGKLDQQIYVPRDLYESQRRDDRERLTKLEDTMTWAFRLVGAAFLGIILEGILLFAGAR